MEKWNPLRKINVKPAPAFIPKVELYAVEEGGHWAASLHSNGAMRVLMGKGSLVDGIEESLRSVRGRQHIEVMTGPAVDVNDYGHILRLTSGCHAGPNFERLMVALGLSQGGNAQKAGLWNENQPEYMGRQKKR
jgi:hypothetical protein